MGTTIPAMRAKFGSNNYFIATMKAGELVDKLKIPKELPEWDDMTLEEKFQREINYNRVKKHIAPYLSHDEDRFFGSLIVNIYNAEGVEFEPMGDVLSEMPGLYKSAAENFGFLHFKGGEVLVPLDGQHRLAAFRFAITGKDEKDQLIKGLDQNISVANDDVTVIFITHDDKKSRKIFNKVNRYAKSTTKAENLITADDDIVAVLTRKLADHLIGQRLVNFKSNTLTPKSHQFTTLSLLYDANLKILESLFDKKIDTTVLPSIAEQKLFEVELESTWRSLLEDGIELFGLSLADRSESGDEKRQEIRAHYLLGKPIAQLALVIAFIRLIEADYGSGKKLNDKDVVDRLNSLDWSVSNPIWQKVLMNGDKVATGKQAALFASRFISYLCGEPLEKARLEALEKNYKDMHPPNLQKNIKLPKKLF